MTVTAVEAPRSGAAKQVLDAVRVHGLGRTNLVVVPLVVMAAVFVLNVGIFLISANPDPSRTDGSGGMAAVFAVVGVSHVQSITQVFPFALGISVTRRAFSAATALVMVAQSAAFGLVLTLLFYLEGATGGWGLRLHLFRFSFLEQSNPFAQWAVFAVPFLTVAATCVLIGVVVKRWGQVGMYTMVVIVAALLVGAAGLVSWLRLWPVVGAYLANTSSLALIAGYPLVIVAVLSATAFALLRRATP